MFILEIYSQMAEFVLEAARSFAQILKYDFKKAIEKLDKQAPTTIFDFDQQTQKFNLFDENANKKLLDEKLLDDFQNIINNNSIYVEDITCEIILSIVIGNSDQSALDQSGSDAS